MLITLKILCRDHVLAACFRAINDQIHHRLKSRNVHSEIVFSLSPNNNVRIRRTVSCVFTKLEADRGVFSTLWHL